MTPIVDTRSVEEIEKQIGEDAQELIANRVRGIRPLFPQVLVYVLPKASMYKGLVALPSEQNKILHEGIVLATWLPFTQEVGKTFKDGDGREYSKSYFRKSAFSIGDHVVFPHWSGHPAGIFDEKKYRFVRECNWEFDKNGGIEAIVEYDEPATSPSARLAEILGNDAEGIALAHLIEEQYHMIDRATESVIQSGR